MLDVSISCIPFFSTSYELHRGPVLESLPIANTVVGPNVSSVLKTKHCFSEYILRGERGFEVALVLPIYPEIQICIVSVVAVIASLTIFVFALCLSRSPRAVQNCSAANSSLHSLPVARSIIERMFRECEGTRRHILLHAT